MVWVGRLTSPNCKSLPLSSYEKEKLLITTQTPSTHSFCWGLFGGIFGYIEFSCLFGANPWWCCCEAFLFVLWWPVNLKWPVSRLLWHVSVSRLLWRVSFQLNAQIRSSMKQFSSKLSKLREELLKLSTSYHMYPLASNPAIILSFPEL